MLDGELLLSVVEILKRRWHSFHLPDIALRCGSSWVEYPTRDYLEGEIGNQHHGSDL